MSVDNYDYDHVFEYRITGARRVLPKAVQAIKQYCQEINEYRSGPDPDEIYQNKDGSLSWSGEDEGLMFELDYALAKLTHRNSLRIWTYHGENNQDYREGCLSLCEKGKFRSLGYWDSDIGFDAAMAAVELEQSANVEAAVLLVKELEYACKRPGRLSTVLAGMITVVLKQHPSLDAHESIWPRIIKLQSQIAASSFDHERAGSDRECDTSHISWLVKNIEARKLEICLNEVTDEKRPSEAVRL